MMRPTARAKLSAGYRTSSRALACAIGVAWLVAAPTASAQGRRRPPPTPSHAESKPAAGQDDEDDHAPLLRTEPEIAPPSDPLAVSPETRERIGTDWDGRPPSPEGAAATRWSSVLREPHRRLPLSHPPAALPRAHARARDPTQALYGVPKTEDTEGLYGLLYYRRRSLDLDMDVVFPALWRVRDRQNHVVVAGPLVHREAPGENDNWLAPLFFEGARKNGGYFHSPLLLTTSHWGPEGAFTLVGPYFRDRTGPSVDMGVAPFFFHGDNGNVDGGRRTYTLIPPLLFYHAEHELDASTTTIVGPVIVQSNPKRSVFDVAPLFFHIEGKPETGGVRRVAHDALSVFSLRARSGRARSSFCPATTGA